MQGILVDRVIGGERVGCEVVPRKGEVHGSVKGVLGIGEGICIGIADGVDVGDGAEVVAFKYGIHGIGLAGAGQVLSVGIDVAGRGAFECGGLDWLGVFAGGGTVFAY